MTLYIILGFLGGIGAPELILIGLILLLMFGGKKLPELEMTSILLSLINLGTTGGGNTIG